jgi:lysophospholipase L1-like esterase
MDPGADLPTIVCYGDSNTHGYDPATGGRLGRDVRWPGVVARELAGRAHVVEEGLNGRTTVWDDPFTEGRNGRVHLLPCLRSHAPVAVVVIMLGTNDLKAVFRVGAAEVASGARTLVELARTSGTGPDGGPPTVLLVAPPPLGPVTEVSELWGFAAAREASLRLAPLYRTAARLTGAAFLDAAEVATVDPADGVHIDPGSHAPLGRAIAAAVAEHLPGEVPRAG